MKFELIHKENCSSPKYPDPVECCCINMFQAVEKELIKLVLQNEYRVQLGFLPVKYCPFCSEKIECQQVD